jgi:hypothetical protein
VHHRHHSTPNRRRPCRSRHDLALDSMSIFHRFSSRAWREEAARTLLVHASPLSPPLASTPCRPEPPLPRRTPAGRRSAASVRELAGICKRPKPPPTPSAESTPQPLDNAEAVPPLPSLLFALAHRAPPRAYKASTPLLLSFSFTQTIPPPPHSLTKRTQSKPAPLPSGEGALRLPSNREEGGNGIRFRPSLTAILSLPSPSF